MKYLFIILIVTACGQSNKSATLNIPLSIDTNAAMINITDANAADTNKPAPNPFVGSWKSACLDALIIEDTFNADLTNVRKAYTYADDDLNCEGDLQGISSLNRTYSFNGSSVDFTSVACSVEPKAQALVDYFNNTYFFGYDTWVVNKPVVLTGQGDGCKKGEMMYSIFKVIKDKLYAAAMDNIHDGSSADERPLSYDMNTPLTKE